MYVIIWKEAQNLFYKNLFNIPAMQFSTGILRNNQSKFYAIIDWVCLEIPLINILYYIDQDWTECY